MRRIIGEAESGRPSARRCAWPTWRRDLGGAVRALYNFARTSVTAALGTLSLPLSLRDLIHGEDDGGPGNRRLRVV